MKKKIISSCLFVLVTLKSFASSDTSFSTNLVEPPPETASIDHILSKAFVIGIVTAAYYLNKRASKIL